MGVYLRAKFEVSSIILTSFRQGECGNFTPHRSKRTPKKPTQIRVNNLFVFFLSRFISLTELKTFLYLITYLFIFLTHLFI